MHEGIDFLLNKSMPYEEFVKKTKKNQQRLNDVYDQVSIPHDVLTSLTSELSGRKIKILVVGENWCSDCVLVLPVLRKISENFDSIDFSVVSRDDVMDVFSNYFLTAGKAKIPFVLFLNENNEELCRWVERSNYMFKKIFKLQQKNLSKVDYYREALKLYLEPTSIKRTTDELIYALERAILIAKSVI